MSVALNTFNFIIKKVPILLNNQIKNNFIDNKSQSHLSVAFSNHNEMFLL